MKEYLMLQIYIVVSAYMNKIYTGADKTSIRYEKNKITLEIEKNGRHNTFEINIKKIYKRLKEVE